MSKHIPIIKLIEAMNEQPIAFNKHYVFLGCGINGALMLSQLVYWTSRTKDHDGWVYKDHHEWTQETGLTRKEQHTARKTLKSLGFISEKKHGVPPRVFFRVERENLYKALIEYSETTTATQLCHTEQLNVPNGTIECAEQHNHVCQKEQLNVPKGARNTENTTENTTDIKLGASAPKQPKKFSAKKFLIENGVSEKTAQEFIDLKNKKRKTITDRSLKIIFNQATEAQLTNERVFQIIVLRGWESFKAAWNWAETNAELEQLENPQVKGQAQEQAPPVFKGVKRTFKGMNND
ncbi:DNA-binding protein [Acinetobacter sp. YH12064]|uniref:DNA-binding protein n=1 Tax=Acinetobacter sp. YH12064 TaxID=2601062 RepID=UPI0015D1F2B5|nr:DNA-binding protein [Acinetobacter sp. YH12064]